MVSHKAELTFASFRHMLKRLLLRRARASFGRDWRRRGARDGVSAVLAVASAVLAVASVAPTTAVVAPSTPATVSSCIFRGSPLIREEDVRKYILYVVLDAGKSGEHREAL